MNLPIVGRALGDLDEYEADSATLDWWRVNDHALQSSETECYAAAEYSWGILFAFTFASSFSRQEIGFRFAEIRFDCVWILQRIVGAGWPTQD